MVRWMAAFAVSWAVMYFLVHGLQGFGESIYMIDRLKLLAEGGRPYRDFEFAYGVLLLYGPRALMVLHLSAEQAYFVFLLACYLGGIWMLARIFALLDYPSEHKATIFSMLCLLGLQVTLSTGLNYVLLRFISAPYFGLLVQRTDSQGSGRRDRIFAMLMAAGFTVLMLMISPEMGVAFGAGTIGYFCVFCQRDWRSVTDYVGFLGIEVAIFLGADRLGIFFTLKAFSGGAFSFPIVPAPHILLFFVGCGLVTLFVAERFRSGSRGDGMLMVVAVSGAALFAALSRCDPGHTVLSGIGLVIVAAMLASSVPKFWRWYRLAFFFFFLLIPMATGVWSYRPLLSKLIFLRVLQSEPHGTQTCLDRLMERAMERQLGHAQGRIKFEKLKGAGSAATEFDLHAAFPQLSGVLTTPFGFAPKGFGIYHSANLRPGYFAGLNNLFTPAMVRRKIEELQADPGGRLLLPDNFVDQCKLDPVVAREQMRTLLAYPFSGTVRHSDSVWAPLCSYIDSHYRRTIDMGPQGYGYSVWAE